MSDASIGLKRLLQPWPTPREKLSEIRGQADKFSRGFGQQHLHPEIIE